MKKYICFLLAAILTFALTACGRTQQSQPAQGIIERPQLSETTTAQPEARESKASDPATAGKILIAYFTVPETDGVDAVASASRVVTGDGVVGNTEFIAREIQKNLGGDLFAIQTVQSYPGSHSALLDFAYAERTDKARPELATHIEDLAQYDYIFVGYPNWNADLPMPMYTFFEEYDFSGKTIIPFVTHGGSGFSGTIRTIQSLESNATVIESGLSVSRNSVPDAAAAVKTWTNSLLAD